jgi:hypothetical protein
MTGPLIRSAAHALELIGAVKNRADAGVTWIPDGVVSAHYRSTDERSTITVRPRKTESGAWWWQWDAYHDGRTVTPPARTHTNAVNAMIHAERFIDTHRENVMAGPYCAYCDQRCFVYRVAPTGIWSGLMATCPVGTAHDRDQLGFDHTTAINPAALAQLMRLLYDVTKLDAAATRRVLATVLRGLTVAPIDPARYQDCARYLEETTDDDRTTRTV